MPAMRGGHDGGALQATSESMEKESWFQKTFMQIPHQPLPVATHKKTTEVENRLQQALNNTRSKQVRDARY